MTTYFFLASIALAVAAAVLASPVLLVLASSNLSLAVAVGNWNDDE